MANRLSAGPRLIRKRTKRKNWNCRTLDGRRNWSVRPIRLHSFIPSLAIFSFLKGKTDLKAVRFRPVLLFHQAGKVFNQEKLFHRKSFAAKTGSSVPEIFGFLKFLSFALSPRWSLRLLSAWKSIAGTEVGTSIRAGRLLSANFHKKRKSPGRLSIPGGVEGQAIPRLLRASIRGRRKTELSNSVPTGRGAGLPNRAEQY